MNNNEMHPMKIPYKKVGDYYLPMFSYPVISFYECSC